MKLLEIKIKEILRFIVGGGSAVVTDYLIYTMLKRIIEIGLAKGISYVAGALVGFVINKLWTFESKQFNWGEVGKYIILYAFSAVINTIINSSVLWIINSTIFAFLCATGISTIINFLGQKFFVFYKKEER